MGLAAKKKDERPRSEIKAERTRAAILAVAEEQFARRGYAATRLDDVAEAVNMTGAALFYYFRDKGALYDAMMDRAFGELAGRLRQALLAPTSIAERIERGVEVWVDAVMARPALARLMLRHVADAEQHPANRVYPGSDAIMRVALPLFEAGRKSGELNPRHDHPYHATSAIVGATIFYASALAPLVPWAPSAPSGEFDPLSPEQVALHKRDALAAVRLYLGIASRADTARKHAKPKTRRQKAPSSDGRRLPKRPNPARRKSRAS